MPDTDEVVILSCVPITNYFNPFFSKPNQVDLLPELILKRHSACHKQKLTPDTLSVTHKASWEVEETLLLVCIRANGIDVGRFL